MHATEDFITDIIVDLFQIVPLVVISMTAFSSLLLKQLLLRTHYEEFLEMLIFIYCHEYGCLYSKQSKSCV